MQGLLWRFSNSCLCVWVFIVSLNVTAQTVTYLHYPENYELPIIDEIKLSEFPAVASETLGITDQVHYFGVHNAWSNPEAVAVFVNEADEPLQLSSMGKNFTLIPDKAAEFMETVEELQEVAKDSFTWISVQEEVMGIYSGADVKLPGGKRELHKNILEKELEMNKAVKDWVSAKEVKNGVPDLYTFHYDGIEELVAVESDADTIAQSRLNLENSILELVNELKKVYENNVVILFVQMPPLVHRRGHRDAQKNPPTPTYFYSPNFPVAFNIILWLMIILAVAVFAISVGIWNLDPGRKSIIYTMTTTRMKRE